MKKKWIISLAMLLALQVMPTQVLKAEEINTSIGQTQQADPAQMIQTKAKMHATMLGATSLQYALIDNGEIVFSGTEGVYSKTENGSLDAQTMYGIGSTSKMFTTAAIMKLVEEGKVDLDQPVTTYIPEFEMKDERYKQITVRMLLNHSSGLMGSSFNDAFLFEDADTKAHDQLLALLKEQRLKADPGAYSVYCNDGFTLAEIVVERVSGIDFTTFIHTSFTEPLGLNNTKTPQDTFDQLQLAKTYNPMNQQEVLADSVNVIGTGGIYSTAEELCKFAELFMRGNEKSLTLETQVAMENFEASQGMWPESGDNSVAYGLGWDSMQVYPFNEYDIKALVKGGDTQLYHA
ncbi:MAG: serine hydrolase domain-containing protein, partial [Niameybacter sp.]